MTSKTSAPRHPNMHRQLFTRALGRAFREGDLPPMTQIGHASDPYGRAGYDVLFSRVVIRFIVDLDALTPTLIAYASDEITDPQTWRPLAVVPSSSTAAAREFLRLVAHKAALKGDVSDLI